MPAGEPLLIIGPPAVGKMTVGRAICQRADFHLFHNHHTIEPLIEIFGFGTPPFQVLNTEFRRRVIEEAAAAQLRLIFTFVWDVDDPADTQTVRTLIAPYADAGMSVSFAELVADLDTRLARNAGADRIAAKPTKGDLAWSAANVREMEQHRMNTDPAGSSPADSLLAEHRHLVVDNTALGAAAVADRIVAWLGTSPENAV
jgi:hypothetical protein